MTFFTLTLRSACFYWRTNTLILTGALLASAILTGVMLADDLITLKLKEAALIRLGHIEWALHANDRFLPTELTPGLEEETGARMTPALLFHGNASKATPGTETRTIAPLQILGVEESFWRLARTREPAPVLPPEGLAINEKLATALQLKPGDQVSIHFRKPTLMPPDTPFTSLEKAETLHATFTVSSIVSAPQLGRFSLAANRDIPCTAFVSLPRLQQLAGLKDKLNLLLAGVPPPSDGTADVTNPGLTNLNPALREVWRLKDAGLRLRTIDNGLLYQLEGDRIFMDHAIGNALSDMRKTVGALTYFVTSIARAGDRPGIETPYSFVVALSPTEDAALGLVNAEMQDHEIIISRWLAENLEARPGDSLKLTYYALGATNRFFETNRVFTIRRIAEMNEVARERELGPFFPGLTEAGRCAEWTSRMPLDRDKLADVANEAYWREYRATPKAFVTLKAGREMWANRLGDLTAIRFRANEEGAEAVTEVLLRQLDPGLLGLAFKPVRTEAINAADEGMDRGDLFRAISYCLAVASLLLTIRLFLFGVRQRTGETDLLRVLGFRSGQIHRLWIQEGVLIALTGATVGAFLGPFYLRAMMALLAL